MASPMSSPVLKRMASLYPATSGGETGGLSCSAARPRAAILRSAHSGVAQLAERRTVNPQVVGSSPTPGAAVTRVFSRGGASTPLVGGSLLTERSQRVV